MNQLNIPVLIEPGQLQTYLDQDNVLVVDVSSIDNYTQHHIPGAYYVEYDDLLLEENPGPGRIATEAKLSDVLSVIGFTNENKHVIAYDDSGGGRASRLLWTLDVLGHTNGSLLNGGWAAWQNAGNASESGANNATYSNYTAKYCTDALADKKYVLSRLGAKDLGLLDARTPEEFQGTDVRAARGGRIPGAANLNWLDAMDLAHHRRFKPDDELRAMLTTHGLTPDKEIICYCQTHHRSSHSYIMLKHLGYPRIAGYAGAWSEWGNDPDTPIE